MQETRWFFWLVLGALVFPLTAHTGHVVHKMAYVTRDLVQGKGETFVEAEKDAVSAIPNGFVRDPKNSPIIGCTVSNRMLIESDGEKCDLTISGNLNLITIPIVAKTN